MTKVVRFFQEDDTRGFETGGLGGYQNFGGRYIGKQKGFPTVLLVTLDLNVADSDIIVFFSNFEPTSFFCLGACFCWC